MADKASKAEDKDKDKDARRPAERVEWAIGFVSAALVLVLIGFLLFEALTQKETPPVLLVELGAPHASDGLFILPIEVRNAGDTTGSDVVVEGTLTREGATPERSSVTLDYVPAQSATRAGLVFVTDPAQADVEVVVKGFAYP